MLSIWKHYIYICNKREKFDQQKKMNLAGTRARKKTTQYKVASKQYQMEKSTSVIILNDTTCNQQSNNTISLVSFKALVT